MRLGIDASNLRAGGGVTHLVELLRAAQPQQHGITRVVIWAGKNTLKEIPAKPWLEPVHEPMLDQPLPVRLYWQKIKLSQLAKQHCDYLFVPGGFYSGTFRPFVTMSRNLLPFEKAERRRYGLSWMSVKLLLLRLGQTKTLRNADGVIFLTEYARSVVKRATSLNGHQPIIPHGINKSFFLSPRDQRPISAYSRREPFKLLYVSTVDVYKHQGNVVEAVVKLRQEGIPLALDLVGPVYPPELRRLRRVISRVDPGEAFIRYRGAVRYSRLVSYYHRADGFVFASSCENMPNILLEAMASGLPIGCSERGPMPGMLGDTGVYFNPERAGEIAKALRSLTEDHALRERCARSAYERAQLYSWERCARETFSYLAGVAQNANCIG